MSYRILLVDDEQMIKLSLRKILSDAHPDFEIVGEASDGLEALQLVEQMQPHAIITDISMPIMDGLEFIRAIAERGWKQELIVLSGYGEFAYAQEALRCGVTDYILKPMRPAVVKELLLGLYGKQLQKVVNSRVKSELFSQCLFHAEPLFNRIWTANEEGAKETVQTVLQLISVELPEDLKKEILQDFVAVIRQMAESRGSRIPFELAWRNRLNSMIHDFQEGFMEAIRSIKRSRNWGKRPVIQKGIEYIHANYADPDFSLEKLIVHLDLSATHFYHLFKQETGKTFITYVIDHRMEVAKDLLRDRYAKTYEIGEKVGYPDYSHFTKIFKKVVGLTPSEFRKNMGFL